MSALNTSLAANHLTPDHIPTKQSAADSSRYDGGDLHELLQAALAYAPDFGHAMSNHLPMALHAAWQIGADTARLQRLFAHEQPKLAASPVARPAQLESARLAAHKRIQQIQATSTVGSAADHLSNEWLSYRGDNQAYAWLYHYFKILLQHLPAAEVISSHLVSLLKSPHAFAFHGLIRTAHAWEAGHANEIAAALATWASFWEVLPAVTLATSRQPELGIDDWILQLRRVSQQWQSPVPMISFRMRCAAETKHYAELAESLQTVATLAERRTQLLALARSAYLHSANFTVLHLITGLRALGVLLPMLPKDCDQASLIAALDRATVAGWMAGRVQWQDQVAEFAPASWCELHAAALAQDDEHVIKGVHACWYEDNLAPHPDWRKTAQRMLKQDR